MMDNEEKSLIYSTELETAELEKMAVIINAKHEALSKLNTQRVQQILVEELEELKRIKNIEAERAVTLKKLSISGDDLNNVAVLKKKLGKETANSFISAHSKFRESFARVMSLNAISRALLKHSLAFIKQNINILTEGGKRKLVDRKA